MWARISQPWAVALLSGLLATGLSAVFFNPLLSTIGDNAQYIVLGESILAGKGLSHVNAPDEKPDTKYPFMFPVILAGVLAIVPGSIVALKLVSVVACVGAAVLYYPVLRRSSEPAVACAAAVLGVMSPDILRHSSVVLAEVPYLFASFVVLGWVALAEDRWSERRWVPAALALLMVAYYLKAIGVALAGGLFLSLLFRGRVRWGFAFLGGFVLLALPWALRAQRLAPSGTYWSYLLMKNPYRPDMGMATAGELLARLGGNVKIYFTRIVPDALLPFEALRGIPGTGIRVLWFAASAIIALGLVYRLRHRRAPVDFYLLGFLAICAVWPQVWAAVRFIVPIIPLLFFCLFTGLWVLLSPLDRRGRGRLRTGVVAGVAVVLGAGLLVADRIEAEREREYPLDWKSYFAAARWVKENTVPESVFVCRKPYLFYLESGRRAVGYRFSEDVQEVIGGMEALGATHVVVDNFRWTNTSARYLVPAVLAEPQRFPVLHVTEGQVPTVVSRFLRSAKEEES